MTCKRQKCSIDQDPDYENITDHQKKRVKLLEKDANEASIKKIQQIVKNEFSQAISEKEMEVDIADQRLHQLKIMLDRLRAYVVAGYYSTNEKLDSAGRNTQTSVHPAVKRLMAGKRPKANNFASALPQLFSSPKKLPDCKSYNIKSSANVEKCATNNCDEKESKKQVLPICETSSVNNSGLSDDSLADSSRASRFKVTRKIIVGNISKYIPVDKREHNDQSTHKWMVYVRAPKEDPSIDTYVKKVWFFLHPSYRPNDLVEIDKPPFQLTRRGWGEFPVRVQLHFHDPRNKRRDILHHLKLGRTLTGLETIEAETVTKVHIYKTEKTLPISNVEVPEKPLISTELTTREDASTDENSLDKVFNTDCNSALKQKINYKLVTSVTETNSEIEHNYNNTEPIKMTTVKTTTIAKDVPISTKTQDDLFSNPTSLLNSPKQISRKMTMISHVKDVKNSNSTRQEKPQIIVSPSMNNQCVKLVQDPSTLKQWTTGVSLLQKVKPNSTSRTSSGNTNSSTLLILPKTNNQVGNNVKSALNKNIKINQTPTPVILISGANSTSTNLDKNPSLNETSSLSSLYCSTVPGEGVKLNQIQSQVKTQTSLINPQIESSNNYVTYVKCVNQEGELFLVPETLLKIPSQQALPGSVTDGISGSTENQLYNENTSPKISLPMYHLQVIPTSGTTSQAQLIQVPSSRFPTTSTKTIHKIKQVKSLLIAQNSSTSKSSNLGTQFNSSTQNFRHCTSNLDADLRKKNIENLDELRDVVKYFVKLHPLIAENYDRVTHPYCTSSVDVFLSWHIGKQRAAEWQRAKAVQRSIVKAFTESLKWKEKKVWSTKDIMWWCRRWGFTPVPPENSEGELSHENKNKAIIPTYTEAAEICKQLEKIENDYKSNEVVPEEEIDVTSVDVPVQPLTKLVVRNEMHSIFHLMGDPQVEFVREAAAQIGVKLKPVEVMPGITANLVEEIILSACKCMVENLVRNSLAQGFERLGNKRCPSFVTLDDVYHCIQSIPEFDFLTNKFLGKKVKTDTSLPPSKNETRQS